MQIKFDKDPTLCPFQSLSVIYSTSILCFEKLHFMGVNGMYHSINSSTGPYHVEYKVSYELTFVSKEENEDCDNDDDYDDNRDDDSKGESGLRSFFCCLGTG